MTSLTAGLASRTLFTGLSVARLSVQIRQRFTRSLGSSVTPLLRRGGSRDFRGFSSSTQPKYNVISRSPLMCEIASFSSIGLCAKIV